MTLAGLELPSRTARVHLHLAPRSHAEQLFGLIDDAVHIASGARQAAKSTGKHDPKPRKPSGWHTDAVEGGRTMRVEDTSSRSLITSHCDLHIPCSKTLFRKHFRPASTEMGRRD